VVDHLETLDRDRSNESRDALLHTAKLAPEVFTPPLIAHCFALLEARERWFPRERSKIAPGGINVKQSYTAVVKRDGQWWIGWIEEVPGVNCQERTRDELLESLRVTLAEALEMNRADAKKAAGKDYEELTIAV
jgi:predicted RNase H-like HicB family nuclease